MYDNWNYTQLHQKELLRKAAQMRLAGEVMRSRKSLFTRFLVRLGGWMVAAGQALHKHYAPARPAVPTYVSTPMPVLTRDMASWYVGQKECDEPSEATRREVFTPRALWRRSR